VIGVVLMQEAAKKGCWNDQDMRGHNFNGQLIGWEDSDVFVFVQRC